MRPGAREREGIHEDLLRGEPGFCARFDQGVEQQRLQKCTAGIGVDLDQLRAAGGEVEIEAVEYGRGESCVTILVCSATVAGKGQQQGADGVDSCEQVGLQVRWQEQRLRAVSPESFASGQSRSATGSRAANAVRSAGSDSGGQKHSVLSRSMEWAVLRLRMKLISR